MQEQLIDIPINILLDPTWCAWFSGFVDGEGYFQISISKHCSLALTITLREDDREIIDEISHYLLGRVYYLSYKRDRIKGKHSCNQWAWKIRNIDHIIERIIPILDLYPLRTKKRNSFEIWKEAAWLVRNKYHLYKPGYDRFSVLHQNLINVHKSPYLVQEMNYFIAEFDEISHNKTRKYADKTMKTTWTHAKIWDEIPGK